MIPRPCMTTHDNEYFCRGMTTPELTDTYQWLKDCNMSGRLL